MSNEFERGLAQYYRQIMKKIVGFGKEKRVFLENLQNNVAEYCEQRPGVTLTDIQEHFGYPDHIADEYMAAMDEDTLRQRLSRARVVKISVIAVAVVLIVTIVSVGVAVVSYDKATDGYSEEITITYMDGYTEEEVRSFYD